MSLWAGQVAGLITDLAGQDLPVGGAVERLATAIAAGVGCKPGDVRVNVTWERSMNKPLSFHLVVTVGDSELAADGQRNVWLGDFEFGPVGGLVAMLDRFAAEVRAARK